MIELIIINSLIIFGVYASLQEGFIFGWIGNWIKGFPEWAADPIGACPICMASVYGTPVFWFDYSIGLIECDYPILVYLGYTVALAGLNYLILAFKPNP